MRAVIKLMMIRRLARDEQVDQIEQKFAHSFLFYWLNTETMETFARYRPRTYVRREVMFSQVCVCSGGGYPVSVKGKIFDTRFGLIHVQTGKKFFVKGCPTPPPPPPVKGKIFDTRFGLIHVQTGKKFLSREPPTPP